MKEKNNKHQRPSPPPSFWRPPLRPSETSRAGGADSVLFWLLGNDALLRNDALLGSDAQAEAGEQGVVTDRSLTGASVRRKESRADYFMGIAVSSARPST